MTTADLSRYVAIGIGSFQILANGASLVRGLSRLPAELAKEGASHRLADLLRTTWMYATLGNLCVSVVLLCIAPGLREREPLARAVAVAIGAYYVVVGIATYTFSPASHPALLVFSALGLALLAAVWL